MSRSVVGYIRKYLNTSASASVYGSTEPATGLPIATGIGLGVFQEFTDAEALQYSNPAGVQLYSGTYQWVKLDPAVTGTVPLGSALYWLQTATGPIVTTVASGNAPDFAGVSIDPNFGASLPYAFIQNNGKCSCLFDATLAAIYGAGVILTSVTATTFTALAAAATASTGLSVGYSLAAIPVSTVGLVRITRPIVRF